MQRISSWFEQLPLRRRSSQRRTENRHSQKQSKSAAPRLRYSVSAVQQNKYRDHSADGYANSLIEKDQQYGRVPDSWNRQETVSEMYRDYLQPKCASLSQAFSSSYCCEPMRIRTNPWISRRRPSINQLMPPKPPNDLYYPSVDYCPSSTRVKSLDESTCSSGYGSQDSSPESSVHSPDWQPSSKINRRERYEDKAVECHSIDVDEALGLDFDDNNKESDDPEPLGDVSEDDHIYHELEMNLNYERYSMILNDNACSSDSDMSYTPTSSQHSQQSSPIYSQPYPLIKSEQSDDSDDFPNTAASFTFIPSANYRPAPKFHAPPPPPVYSDFDQAELDFLVELDAQIAELQVKSVAVRQLVDGARERRDAHSRSHQMYMKELSELRQLKWVLQDRFELVL
uniref:SOAR domain-containing protein n=1 Tax=Syphacia muris TaxID=451379 RepID=A0A0N5ANX1_9BILA